jgi:protein-S-isoprenylcysteine O-methyltransferase Ste14
MSAAPQARAIRPRIETKPLRRWFSRLVAIIYGLAMFEVVIMISPFAFYFYSAYGPTLKWLNHSKATAWLTGFVLPHSVFTTSAFLEFLRWDLGRYAFGLGLLAFFVFAAQIYGSKLLGKKMVTSGVYRYIRHPQYLCLSVSAFGLLTIWPRMIVFLLFIGVLFAYYFLARAEERRMLALAPSYADYMNRTGMFLLGNPGGRLFRLLFKRVQDQRFAHRLVLGISMMLLLVAGLALRAYTLRHISRTTAAANVELVSVYPMRPATMQKVAALALADTAVQQALQREGNATFVVHILPHDYGMMGMFADVGARHMTPGNVHLRGFRYLGPWLLPFLQKRTEVMGSQGGDYRIVFSRVDDPHGIPASAAGLFDLSQKMTPVYVVDVNAASDKVSGATDPPRRSFWGDVKMPIF